MSSTIAGKKIVFTGKMETGDRDDLAAQAASLGANVEKNIILHAGILLGVGVGSIAHAVTNEVKGKHRQNDEQPWNQ